MSSVKSFVDRRYQVFISSTFKDLAEQRKKAVQVVFERGHIPIAMERFSAKDETDLKVIKQAIASCQIYVLVLGHRYGELVPGLDISFTELEYNLAREHQLLTLVLQMDPEEASKQRAGLDFSKKEDSDELLHEERLRRFHERLKVHHRQYWKPEEEFKYDILKALADNLPHCGRRGFVPEPEDPTLIETAGNEFIIDIVNELKGFQKLYTRVSQEAAKKRALAQCFRQRYANKIIRERVSLFFESGSTVAYVAKELAAPLCKGVRIGSGGEPNIKISTNNVLAYLLLWLTKQIPSSPFPWSPPSEKTYGAWYGGLEEGEPQDPDYSGAPLDTEANEEIKKLLEHPFKPNVEHGPALLLGAASGLQIGTNHKLRFHEGLKQEVQDKLRQQLETCFGPHVGSYHNKVFKRFMYATKVPVVIFLTADKIDCEIEVGKCHFILDRQFSWEEFYKSHPVAFCIGCSQDEKQACVRTFGELNFEIEESHAADQITAFVARNSSFIHTFEKGQITKNARQSI